MGGGNGTIVVGTGLPLGGLGMCPVINPVVNPSLVGGVNPLTFDLGPASGGALRIVGPRPAVVPPIFRLPSPAAGGDRMVPSIMDAPIEELRDWSREASQRYLTAQRATLDQNFNPCEAYNLAENIDSLPEVFRPMALGLSSDRQIYFQIEPIPQPGGLTVPQLRFFRRATATGAAGNPSVRLTVNSSPEIPMFMARSGGGAAVLEGPADFDIGVRFGGPQDPMGPQSEGALRFGVGLGGAAAMYAVVDASVSRLPRHLQAPVGMAEFVVMNQALYHTSASMVEAGWLSSGFMSRPQWNRAFAPTMFVAGIGISQFYNAVGITDPRANGWATFLSSSGLYLMGPSIAADYPALGAAFNSSIGVGLTPMTIGGTVMADGTVVGGTSLGIGVGGWGGGVFLADGGIAGGAGVLGGAFQAVGAAAIPLVGNFVTDVVWSLGRENSGESDLFWTAWDGSMRDFLGSDLAAGTIGRFLQLLQVLGGGLREGGVIDDGVNTMYDRFLRDTTSGAQHMNEGLMRAAIASLEEEQVNGRPSGNFRINWDTFEASVRGIYQSRPETLQRLRNAISMLRNSVVTSGRVSWEARGMTDSFDGSGRMMVGRGQMMALLQRIFGDTHNNYVVSNAVRSLLSTETNALAERANQLRIPTDRNVRESELNQEQRAFLHGDGSGRSELLMRRERIATLRHLLDRFEREPSFEAPNLQATWFNDALPNTTRASRSFTVDGELNPVSVTYFTPSATAGGPPEGYHVANLPGTEGNVWMDDYNYQRFSDYLIRNEAAAFRDSSESASDPSSLAATVPSRFDATGHRIPIASLAGSTEPAGLQDALNRAETPLSGHMRMETHSINGVSLVAFSIPRDASPEARTEAARIAHQNGLVPHFTENPSRLLWTTPLGWQHFMEHGGRIQAGTLTLGPEITGRR